MPHPDGGPHGVQQLRGRRAVPARLVPWGRGCLAGIVVVWPAGAGGGAGVGCGAAEQLRAATAAGERSGTSVTRMAGVLREAMRLARVCLYDLHLGPVYGGFDPDFGERSGPAGVAGAMVAAGCGAVGDGDGDGVGETHAAAASKRLAVRAAFMLTELLPALSLGVRLCTKLAQQGRGQGPGGAGARRESPVAAAQAWPEFGESLVYCAVECAGRALSCTAKVMARLHREAPGEKQGNRGGGGGSTSGGDSGGGSCPADTEWRQLLLRGVQLMDLMGAGVALVQLGATTAAGAGKAAGDASAELCNTVAQVLPLEAVTFPAEFRAAVGAGATGASGPGLAVGAHGSTSSCGQLEASRCVSLAAIREVLKGICCKDNSPQYKTLAAVLGDGCAPMQQKEIGRLGRLVWICHESRPEAKTFLVMLPPPGEACAGVAAAAEAAAAAAQRGPAVG